MKEILTSYLLGAVRIRIVGENKERFVNLCRNSDIYIWDIRNGTECTLCIAKEDFFKLKPIIRKTFVRIKIMEKYGLPFLVYRYRKRVPFCFGIATSFVMIYVLSLFIWDMQVDGNYTYSSYEILRFLKEEGVSTGVKKAQVNCDAVEKSIRNHYFDITWVSVEITGTRLIVHIKENEEEIRRASENTDEANGESYDLAATKQAVVTNVVMRGGTAAVKTDMQVQPGDILVYGRYDIVDDNKEIVRTQYLRADADVYGKVVYGYEDILPLAHTEKEYYGKEKKKISFRAGDKIWEIANTKKKKNQEVVTQEKQLYLYDNFYLPFYLIQESRKTYTEKEYQYSREQAEQIAEEKLSYFIEKLEKNTIQIVENNVTIETNDNVCRSSGAITVIENIGQLQPAAPEDLTGETTENYE